MNRFDEIRTLLSEIQTENRMTVPERFFYELEHAGLIQVDQENWSWVPGKAEKLKDKAQRFDELKPTFNELWGYYKDSDLCLGSLERQLFENLESIFNGGDGKP